MKKILTTIFLVVITATFLSCSKDDDDDQNSIEHPATGTLSLKINDVQHNFGTLKVFEERYADYTDLIVKGTDVLDPTKTVSISLGKNLLGAGSVYFVQYTNNGTFYQNTGNNMNTDITESNDSKIMGTFAGTVTTINMDNLEITEGVLNISY
jgi:hypothetical protein